MFRENLSLSATICYRMARVERIFHRLNTRGVWKIVRKVFLSCVDRHDKDTCLLKTTYTCATSIHS